ncbi:MAG: hypothetical protein NTW83_14920 [Cyanobacteria bacterium]|nr:hypothetical protein [Cyanobacteriota bacterium]
MAERGSTASPILASAIAGAVIGAAGLAWWLLAEAESRRLAQRQRRTLTLSRLQGGSRDSDDGERRPLLKRELQHKVNELNRAIEDVRRQLETLSPEA